MRKPLEILLIALLTTACAPSSTASTSEGAQSPTSRGTSKAVATFAGGCFWCVEKPLEKVPGVQAVISGYTGGHVARPTYKQVGSGKTGHTEAIQVHFDPNEVRYEDLLEVFWRQINPTDADGQFVDRGSQYRSEIFYHDESQKLAALESRKKLASSGRFKKPVVTPITALRRFYVAEDYHQDFYKKDPRRYESYRRGSGRDRYLDQVWGKDRKYSFSRPASRPSGSYRKPSDEVLRAKLTKIQYEVTQRDGTEPPFKNKYWDNKKAGIYVDIVSGEPLFSSLHKYKSGTGWPSFFRTLEEKSIKTGTDHKLRYARTELRSAKADSHLGHLFKDGPKPTGLRYCINSAALRFIPRENLEKEGYARYLKTFTPK